MTNAKPRPASTTAGGSSNGQLVPFEQKVTSFRTTLEKLKPQLALALPKHLDPNRLARIVLTSVQKTPELLDCSRESLLGAILQAAQLGLEPDGTLGHAYLIPYKKVCTLVAGYKGLLKLARQSGEISAISAHVVQAKDEFDYDLGLNQTLVHKPARPKIVELKDEETGEVYEGVDPAFNPGPIIAAYAVAKLKDGTQQFEVMNRLQIDRIRDRSPAGKSGPWVDHYPEMAKKTVLRRLCKMLPASVDLQRAVALDERADAGIEQEFENIIDVTAVDGPKPAPASKLDILAEQVKAKGYNCLPHKMSFATPEEAAAHVRDHHKAEEPQGSPVDESGWGIAQDDPDAQD